MTRREVLRLLLGAGLCASSSNSMAATGGLIQKPIPRNNESLPLIGLGTWQTFDVGAAVAARAPLRDVLREFVTHAGSVIDSSPMYGRSETVVGELATELGFQSKFFLATKVWTQGREAGMRQMEQSFERLRTKRIDLMQVHNLVDWRTHLTTLRSWKDQGRVRYIGVTHYSESAYNDLERVLQAEPLDFVQINYSVAEREADKRLLPLAAEKQIAVLANRPFGGGGLFNKVLRHPLPSWAGEVGCSSWAQLLLKFVISHPAVTCAIPATSKADHLQDNMKAGLEPLPDEQMRVRIARYVQEL